MPQHSDLFRLEDGLEHTIDEATLMHVALDGFLDAGQVRHQIVEHVMSTLDAELVATFDTDALIDYRGRRPPMTFDTDHWAGYEQPTLQLHRLHDSTGRAFLLLHGAEPDFRWEAFGEAVHQLALAFGVRLMTMAHGIPMAVPHTRPVGMTRFASDPDLIPGNQPLFGQVQVPGSAEALLQIRMAEAGLGTVGMAAHVPHYLAESVFGDAAVAALDVLLETTGLEVPTADLVEAAGLNRAEIAEHVEASPEVGQAVAEMEKRYDHFLEGKRQRSALAAQDADLPSADELGAEFEEFLRSGDEDPESPAPGQGPGPGDRGEPA